MILLTYDKAFIAACGLERDWREVASKIFLGSGLIGVLSIDVLPLSICTIGHNMDPNLGDASLGNRHALNLSHLFPKDVILGLLIMHDLLAAKW